MKCENVVIFQGDKVRSNAELKALKQLVNMFAVDLHSALASLLGRVLSISLLSGLGFAN